jgi:hypothetical protein
MSERIKHCSAHPGMQQGFQSQKLRLAALQACPCNIVADVHMTYRTCASLLVPQTELEAAIF